MNANTNATQNAQVVAVASSAEHNFSKTIADRIRLLQGLGVEGDAHSGKTVQHLSRMAHDPTQPNLRQVHLVHSELLEELATAGFAVEAGNMGENIITAGLDLLALPTGTELQIGADARVRLTGLRNPCRQLDAFQQGLMKAVLGRAADGSVVRKAGVMAVVLSSGDVKQGDAITVHLPAAPHQAMEPV